MATQQKVVATGRNPEVEARLPRQLAETTAFQRKFGSFGRFPKSPEPSTGFRIRFHPFSPEPNCS